MKKFYTAKTLLHTKVNLMFYRTIIYILLCVATLGTVPDAYAGYCPVHSGSGAETEAAHNRFKEELTKTITEEIVKSSDFLRFCDRMYKASEARWADKYWRAQRVSTAVGTVINQWANLKQLKDNTKTLTEQITTLIIAGPDGLAENYENYATDNDFLAAGHSLAYGLTALLVDKKIFDDFAEDFYNRYENKNWLMRIGFNTVYKFTAWVLGDDELLECTHASPNCPPNNTKNKDNNEKQNKIPESDKTPSGDNVTDNGTSSDGETVENGDSVYQSSDAAYQILLNGGTDSQMVENGDLVCQPSDDNHYITEEGNNENSDDAGNIVAGWSGIKEVFDAALDEMAIVGPTIPHKRVLWLFSGESLLDSITSLWEGMTGNAEYKNQESTFEALKGKLQ